MLTSSERKHRASIPNNITIPSNTSYNNSPHLINAAAQPTPFGGTKRYLFSVYKKKPLNDMSKVHLMPRDYQSQKYQPLNYEDSIKEEISKSKILPAA